MSNYCITTKQKTPRFACRSSLWAIFLVFFVCNYHSTTKQKLFVAHVVLAIELFPPCDYYTQKKSKSAHCSAHTHSKAHRNVRRPATERPRQGTQRPCRRVRQHRARPQPSPSRCLARRLRPRERAAPPAWQILSELSALG